MLDEYEEWKESANCAGIENPDVFFPPRDKVLYKVIAAEAKVYCVGDDVRKACPVRAECLLTAIRDDEQHGIWGGMSHRERNALVRKWRRQFQSTMTLEEYVEQIVGR